MNQAAEVTVILVTEDEVLVRMFVTDALMDTGKYRVIEAVHAAEALRVLEARPDVQLLFTDVNMPGAMDAMALAKVVAERWPGVHIIITSALGPSNLADWPKKARFLPKPYRAQALVDLIDEVLAKPIASGTPSESIVLPVQTGSAVLPVGPAVSHIDTGNGVTGGPAQPLAEAEE